MKKAPGLVVMYVFVMSHTCWLLTATVCHGGSDTLAALSSHADSECSDSWRLSKGREKGWGVASIADAAKLRIGCCVGLEELREKVEECKDEMSMGYCGLRCWDCRRQKDGKGCWLDLAVQEGDRAFVDMDSRLFQEK